VLRARGVFRGVAPGARRRRAWWSARPMRRDARGRGQARSVILRVLRPRSPRPTTGRAGLFHSARRHSHVRRRQKASHAALVTAWDGCRRQPASATWRSTSPSVDASNDGRGVFLRLLTQAIHIKKTLIGIDGSTQSVVEDGADAVSSPSYDDRFSNTVAPRGPTSSRNSWLLGKADTPKTHIRAPASLGARDRTCAEPTQLFSWARYPASQRCGRLIMVDRQRGSPGEHLRTAALAPV